MRDQFIALVHLVNTMHINLCQNVWTSQTGLTTMFFFYFFIFLDNYLGNWKEENRLFW